MIALVATLVLLVPQEGADREPGAPELDRRATAAYREQDYAAAEALWEDALERTAAPAERARLCYNLGNAAYRQGDALGAVAWYTASLQLRPRDGDAWKNLELARSQADLEPADRGDLAATTRRLLSSLTRSEAEWLLLVALLAWGVCLGGEALRGGRTWRRLAGLGLLGVLVAAAPLAWHLTRPEEPLMVVQEGGAPGRSEPRADAATLTRLAAGEVVRRRDALPGWVGVRAEGEDLWVRAESVFDLER